MQHILKIRTSKRTEFIDITSIIQDIVKSDKNNSGCIIISVPHTTAAIIINESYDPNVAEDINNALNKLFSNNNYYLHNEGNSDAHIKSAIIGNTRTVFFDKRTLMLGSWQGIFLCEFDGPRNREIIVKIIPDLEG